jgi:hypothetical protein
LGKSGKLVTELDVGDEACRELSHHSLDIEVLCQDETLDQECGLFVEHLILLQFNDNRYVAL